MKKNITKKAFWQKGFTTTKKKGSGYGGAIIKNVCENFNWDFDEPSVCAALDKFLGYCCQDLAHEDIRLDHLCYPLIDLDPELSSKSDIYKTSAERLSNDEIELYAKELKT